jgi:hypothetical protein
MAVAPIGPNELVILKIFKFVRTPWLGEKAIRVP